MGLSNKSFPELLSDSRFESKRSQVSRTINNNCGINLRCGPHYDSQRETHTKLTSDRIVACRMCCHAPRDMRSSDLPCGGLNPDPLVLDFGIYPNHTFDPLSGSSPLDKLQRSMHTTLQFSNMVVWLFLDTSFR